MEHAVFINEKTARNIATDLNFKADKHIARVQQAFKRRELLGYHIIVNGSPMTENEMEVVTCLNSRSI